MRSGHEALNALQQLRPRFHPDPASVDGALENQFTSGPREVEGAGGASYAIGSEVLRYLADLPPSRVHVGRDRLRLLDGRPGECVRDAHLCQPRPDVEPSGARVRRSALRSHRSPACRGELGSGTPPPGRRRLPRRSRAHRREPQSPVSAHRLPLRRSDAHPDGRLLVDNTEIPAVQELTEYLESEGAYRFERLLGNCAVYRKVRDRQFGWKSQAIGRPAADVAAARRELTRLRMEVTPELRASLSGANPLPGWADASKTPPRCRCAAANSARRATEGCPCRRVAPRRSAGRHVGKLARAGTRRRPVSSPQPRSYSLQPASRHPVSGV